MVRKNGIVNGSHNIGNDGLPIMMTSDVELYEEDKPVLPDVENDPPAQYEYAVAEPRLNDKVKVIATFGNICDALIFIEGYMNRYYAEPKIELVLIRTSSAKKESAS